MEYEEFLLGLGAEVRWADVDGAGVFDSAKAVVTVFSVVQSTARKLAEKETRGKAVQTMLNHAKASPHWHCFSAGLVTDIENFMKEVEVD